MVGALKGHTAPVLDMDFSANGKFVASCAEDCGLVPTKEELSCVSVDPVVAASAVAASTASKAASGSAARSAKPKSASSGDGSAPPAPPSPTSSTGSSSAKEENQRAILSRRQRKNRTRAPRKELLRERDDEHEDDQNAPAPSSRQSPAARHRTHHHHRDHDGARSAGGSLKSKPAKEAKKKDTAESRSVEIVIPRPLPAFARYIAKPLQLQPYNDAVIVQMLENYTLSRDEMTRLGYPMIFSDFPAFVIIFQQYPPGKRPPRIINDYPQQIFNPYMQPHYLDANAREFVPGSWFFGKPILDPDSGRGSAGSSLENSDQENSDGGEGGSPTEQKKKPAPGPRFPSISAAIERLCSRCEKAFYVSRYNGEYMHEEECHYHWGKLRSAVDGSPGVEYYDCCGARQNSKGCTTSQAHVWSGIVAGYNGPFVDYVRTRRAPTLPPGGSYGVYALDCEMCFTKRGLEVGKVTLVALDGTVVYETFVKPDIEVIDYNTRFSGITAEDVANATKTIRDVQQDITSFVFAETILIGHGLENDLRVLKIMHSKVIDTCVAFPHFLGWPYRNSLKTLARNVLRREIQVREHDSAEDARIAVDLILRRLQHDFL